jgi:predicted acyl esterase
MRFKAGHAIRLEVSSSNFPCYDANPNTGGRLATEDPIDARMATQIVYHQLGRESRLVLTVGESRPFFAP